MTILFLGNTAEEVGGSAVTETTTNARDANYAPEEFSLESTDSRTSLIAFTPEADMWWHCRAYFPAQFQNNSNADGYWIEFFEQDQETRVCYLDINNGQFRWRILGATDSTTASVPGVLLRTIDIHIVVGATNIDCEFYVDEVLTLSYSRPKESVTGIGGFRLSQVDFSQTGSNKGYYSEIICRTTDTRGQRLCTMKPDGAGGVSDFTGTFNDILTRDTVSAVFGDTNGDISTFSLEAYTGDATPANIDVVVKSLARKGLTGPQNAKAVLRIGGVNYEGSQFSPDGVDHYEEWATDPSGGAWTVADLASLEAGIKAET